MNTVYLHPMIVHFPIALLIIGAVASLVASLISRHPFSETLRTFASLSIIIGAAATLVAILSGFIFTKEMIGIMGEIRDTHILLAIISAMCGCVSAVLMAFSLCSKNRNSVLLRNVAMVSSLITAVMIGATGHYGGMMVFS